MARETWHTKAGRTAATAICLMTGVVLMATMDCSAGDARPARIRKAAVAGQFYENNPTALRREVEEYLAQGKRISPSPRMIVSPHAGYVFSGALAGKAFAAVDPSVTRVILLGPAHHAWFDGVSVPEVDSFETPLGRAALDGEAVKVLVTSPLTGYVPQADAPEHCLEVQVPFIQVAFARARIVPVLMGRVDAGAVAKLIGPLIDNNTLVVASSDLSHYHASDEARRIDKESIQTIVSGSLDGPIDGCGEAPIRVLMMLAKQLELSPVVLDARNSHETAPRYGAKDRVVGYAAIAFVPQAAGSAAAGGEGELSAETKSYLLKLARTSLEACVRGQKLPSTADAPSAAKVASGCFVTLHKHGQLRGCIGTIMPEDPLADAVVDNARNAALQDPRFPRVTPDELTDIDVEVSVLSVPARLEYSSPEDLLAKLVAGRDGVILEDGARRSTFLPQVWEQLPDKISFLQHLSTKGGMAPDGWKRSTVKTYRAVYFGEKDMSAAQQAPF